jgi:putative thioredoxin
MTEFIYFWADWCEPCKTYSPLVEGVVKDLSVPLRKVEVDKSNEALQEAGRYGIRQVPTIVKAWGGGHESLVGAVDQEALTTFMLTR